MFVFIYIPGSVQASKDEGSPVDVAKSYMRARPPWASPSIDHIKPPTPVGIQLFKEETPHLFSGNSTSSSKVHLMCYCILGNSCSISLVMTKLDNFIFELVFFLCAIDLFFTGNLFGEWGPTFLTDFAMMRYKYN